MKISPDDMAALLVGWVAAASGFRLFKAIRRQLRFNRAQRTFDHAFLASAACKKKGAFDFYSDQQRAALEEMRRITEEDAK